MPSKPGWRAARGHERRRAAGRAPTARRRPRLALDYLTDEEIEKRMDIDLLPDNPYLLLTPGPLSTTKRVEAVMLRDWCSWDDDYNTIVERIRHRLVELATAEEGYTAVLMQGSGTFSAEAALSTAVPAGGRRL